MTTEYIETRMVMLDELEPYPGNARRGDPALLAQSLDANGQYRSLIVRETEDGFVVLCGNNTLAALEHRGDTEARCEIVRCDDATALRVNLVDNRASDRAVYDDRARAALLELLDGELHGTGYTEDEADTLIARYEEPEITSMPEDVTTEYNGSEADLETRVRSQERTEHGAYESRGVRDIFLALPAAEADELGRLIMALRETWGALPQGEVILKACRVARAAGELGAPESVYAAADAVYAPESDEEQAGD
jgi:hypothetical protein